MNDKPETSRESDTSKPRVRTFSWGDPAIGADVARSSSGVDFVRKIMLGEVPAPPIMDLVDFRLVKVEPGAVSFEFEPAEIHYNPMGGVHGGIVSTLLDSAMGLSVLSQLPPGSGFSTLEIKVNFVRGITEETGTLRAEGKIVHPGAKVATAEARLVDRQGKLYAHGTTTCIILRETER
ncbi:MAG TPA: PaaI family thioesterase [Stellaceae bacterium]|nr:PaaI family thioesterase [Stellaceae bacterium]